MRSVELVFVSKDNNNKFYRMFERNDKLEVEHDQYGHTPSFVSYPLRDWDKKYNEKIKKGYKDISTYKIVGQKGGVNIADIDVNLFYNTFSNYTKSSVNSNYIIDPNAVTQLMVDDAQDLINKLLQNPSNDVLVSLYTILPRKMSDVKKTLFTGKETESDINKKIGSEQLLLDTLKSNIQLNVTTDGETSIKDILNVDFESVKDDVVLKMINDLVSPTNSSKYKYFKLFKVYSKSRDKQFYSWVNQQQNKSTEFLLHGTRNQNIFSILKSGLILRPTNVVISGAAYGSGIYHSAHTDKSLGYTGHDNDKLFLIQNVHMGNPYVYEGWYRDGKQINRDQMNYPYLSSKGFDSLYVKPGDGLRNSEYIVYNEQQTTTQYLLWLK